MAEFEQQLKKIIAAVWKESRPDDSGVWEDIGDDVPLFSIDEGEESLGLDSLDALEIAMEVEEAFDVVLPTELEPADIRTVRQVVLLLERLLIEQRGSE